MFKQTQKMFRPRIQGSRFCYLMTRTSQDVVMSSPNLVHHDCCVVSSHDAFLSLLSCCGRLLRVSVHVDKSSSSRQHPPVLKFSPTFSSPPPPPLPTVGLPFFILTPQHSPFKRGFFCNDESISYPLREETISYQLLGGVMISFTLVVVRRRCLGRNLPKKIVKVGPHGWIIL